jgi:cell division protein FtsI (penicillin-binding protein 3)
MSYSVNPSLRLKLEGWRARFLLISLLLMFGALCARAVYLQGMNDEFLQREGKARYARTLKMDAARGMVLDRKGEPLAVSTPAEAVCASPKRIKLSSKQMDELAKLLKLSPARISAKLTDTSREFVYLHRRVEPAVANKIIALNIEGVFLRPTWQRRYPAGPEMAHVLGFTNIDENGQEGIELAHDEDLTGTDGKRQVIRDSSGQVIERADAPLMPQPGQDLHLSIDRGIQYRAYRELKAAIAKERAKAGAIVVLDVRTGEVLAAANLPDFNPNDRAKLDRKNAKRRRNRSVTDLFEPGSTLKPFTVAVALEAGRVRPNTVIDTTPGYMKVGRRVIHDVHRHGKITVSEIIQKSSNVGSAKIALDLPGEAMWSMFNDVGFGRLPKSGFPGEASGRVRYYKTWKPIEQATMSYGHGISVSLMQLARSYMVFATDGELKPITLVKRDDPPPSTLVLSSATARSVRDMLEMAVQKGGTAPLARVPGYRVAGKTGTAHKLEDGHYLPKSYISSFVGFAPVSDPRLVIAVMIDEPGGKHYYGGLVAAPVFSRVMGGALRSLGVKPDTAWDADITPHEGDEPAPGEDAMYEAKEEI